MVRQDNGDRASDGEVILACTAALDTQLGGLQVGLHGLHVSTGMSVGADLVADHLLGMH